MLNENCSFIGYGNYTLFDVKMCWFVWYFLCRKIKHLIFPSFCGYLRWIWVGGIGVIKPPQNVLKSPPEVFGPSTTLVDWLNKINTV